MIVYESKREGWRKYSRRYYRINKVKIIYKTIERRKKNLVYTIFRKIKDRAVIDVSFENFKKWYISQKQICSYCETDDPLILNKFTERFTIDRRDNNGSYDLENICLSCWTCNKLKSNFFSYEEFKEIAQKYIKPKWINLKFKK